MEEEETGGHQDDGIKQEEVDDEEEEEEGPEVEERLEDKENLFPDTTIQLPHMQGER